MKKIIKGHLPLALLLLFYCLLLTPLHAEAFGAKKKRPKPHEFGTVLIDNFSQKKGISPAVFPHWLHRAKYSCRLCHLDIGFSMQAGTTGISESDIRKGQYCGACHNGDAAFAPEEKNASGAQVRNCLRCHPSGKSSKLRNAFYEFRNRMPQDRFGNGLNWIKAEEVGLLTIKDSLEGLSNVKAKFTGPPNTNLSDGETTMPDIIFSHSKHAVWNGCALCHPDLFGVKRNEKPYSMQDIFQGEYCGACHGKVAFPNIDCRKCHAKEVF